MMKLGNILWIAGVIGLSGCASQRPYARVKESGILSPPPGRALVLVYAQDLPSGRDFRVYANEELVTEKMRTGRFLYLFAKPGKLHLATTGNTKSHAAEDIHEAFRDGGRGVGMAEMWRAVGGKKEMVSFTVRAGETHYVNMHNGLVRETMDEVSLGDGEKEIQGCVLVR